MRVSLPRLQGSTAEKRVAGTTDTRLALFRATGDREHLAEAKRLLDEMLALVAEEHHEAMRTGVRVNREILAAWDELGG